jgi:hypothetical protein
MVGTAVASQLIAHDRSSADAGVRFELATPEHDAPLRRLLRENPLTGAISLSPEREPSFFQAAALEGSEHQTIIAIDRDRIVCAGSISARQRYVNGEPMRVGYLSALRLDASCRGHASIIRRGYDLFRQLHQQNGPPIYLTSIIADNLPARRLLEKGLRGMPTYRFLGEWVTTVIRRRRRSRFHQPTANARREFVKWGLEPANGAQQRSADIIELLNNDHRQYQFAPVWRAGEIQPENFRIAYAADGTPAACAAIWDQRAIKQTVVRGYANHLKWTRPLINLGATLLGWPRLPRPGTPISHAFISHLAVSRDRPQIAEHLIHSLNGPAHTHKIDYLTLGFDSRDPRLAHIRKIFRPREYISRLYAVHWEDGAALARTIDNRLLAPEVALL